MAAMLASPLAVSRGKALTVAVWGAGCPWILDMASGFGFLGKAAILAAGEEAQKMLGIKPERGLYDWLSGKARFRDVALFSPQGVMVLPMPAGMASLAFLEGWGERLESFFSSILHVVSALIVPAGGEGTLPLFLAADSHVLFLEDSDESAKEALALLKILGRAQKGKTLWVMGSGDRESLLGRFARLDTAAKKLFGTSPSWLGFLPPLASDGRPSLWEKMAKKVAAFPQGGDFWEKARVFWQEAGQA